MTPQDAIKIVTDATATLQLNRQSHLLILKALETLGKALASDASSLQAAS